jgi:hypothetical protein
VVSVAGYSATAIINVIYKTVGDFLAPYGDGILGLSFTMDAYPAVVLDQILAENNLPNTFYLGFGYDGEGVITLGNADPSYFPSNSAWKSVSLDDGIVYYAATPLSFYVDSHLINSNATIFGQTVFDSGTTFLLLSTSLFQLTKSIVQSTYGETNDCLNGDVFWDQTYYCTIPVSIRMLLQHME